MNRRRRQIAIAVALLALLGSMLAWPIVGSMRQERRNRDLIAAIKQSDLAAVDTLLKDGADANAQDEPESNRSFAALLARLFGGRKPVAGPSALLVALGWRDPAAGTFQVVPENGAIVSALFEAGADVNLADKNGDTPLMLAVWTGKETTTRYLLGRGANINAADKNGQTSWRLAYLLGNTHLMQAFLEKGIDVNTQDSAGNCALIWATINGRSDLVTLCLRYHADVNILDRQRCSPRYYAIQFHRKEIEEALKRAGAHLPL